MRLALRIGGPAASRRAWHAALVAALTLGAFCAPCADADAQESAPVFSPRIVDTASTDAAAPGDPAFEFTLDDQMLSRQRGGAVGMLMVAATPQLMRTNGGNNTVTLWDEIAPPSPLPVPVDAARTTQGNVASYQRK